MTFFRRLLGAAALALVAVSVETSSGGQRNYNYDLSGQELTDLYNSRVQKAELMQRPKEGLPICVGVICHSGVRVTLANGSQWLIHKGAKYGISSQTVVTAADNMSSRWEVIRSRDFYGTRTVSDFVSAGGPNYRLLGDNCHDAAKCMMNQ